VDSNSQRNKAIFVNYLNLLGNQMSMDMLNEKLFSNYLTKVLIKDLLKHNAGGKPNAE
jgi:hypothetical protein